MIAIRVQTPASTNCHQCSPPQSAAAAAPNATITAPDAALHEPRCSSMRGLYVARPSATGIAKVQREFRQTLLAEYGFARLRRRILHSGEHAHQYWASALNCCGLYELVGNPSPPAGPSSGPSPRSSPPTPSACTRRANSRSSSTKSRGGIRSVRRPRSSQLCAGRSPSSSPKGSSKLSPTGGER
jgi:hypothetical protein